MPSLDPKTKNWRANIRISGRLFRKRGFLNRNLAELWEFQQRLKYQQKKVGLQVENNLEISIIIESYLTHVFEYKKPKAAARDKLCLNHFRRFLAFKSIHRFNEIHPSFIKEYRDFRKKETTPRGYPSPRTLNIEMVTIRRCFRRAVAEELIEANPCERIPLYKQPRPNLPRYLTKEEIEIIENAARKNKRATCLYEAFAILVRTGMRSGELCSLEIDQVDQGREQILLRAEKTKVGQMRVIPLNQKVKEILSDLLDRAKQAGRKNLLYTRIGTPQTVDYLNHRLRTMLIRLERQGKIQNSRGIHIHTLRRTYISHMIMAGVEPAKVMEIVGHRDWATIKRYLVLSPNYLQEGKDKLPY